LVTVSFPSKYGLWQWRGRRTDSNSYLSPILKSVGVTSSLNITAINLGLAVWNLILAQTAALNVEKFGRRPLLLISTSGLIFSYCFVMGFSAAFATTQKAAMGVAAIPFLFIFYGFYDIAWTPVSLSRLRVEL
jgi:hypothetical protein